MEEELKTVQEVAKAVQEASKATGKVVGMLESAGSFVSEALGSLPADVIGMAGGDWIRQVRIRNLDRLKRRTDEILNARDIPLDGYGASPNVLIPIAKLAKDESRDELQELYARLLANAVDPNRRDRARREFISIVSQMEPLDARLFMVIAGAPNYEKWIGEIRERFPDAPVETGWLTATHPYRMVADVVERLGETIDAVDISFRALRLSELTVEHGRQLRTGGSVFARVYDHCANLVGETQTGLPEIIHMISFDTKGRELLRALEL